MACSTYHDQGCNEECYSGTRVHILAIEPNYGIESASVYLRVESGQGSYFSGIFGMTTIYPEDGWVLVGSASKKTGYSTPILSTCIGAVTDSSTTYKIRMISSSYILEEDTLVVPDTHDNPCYIRSCEYTLVPNPNACGEIGGARIHGKSHFTVSPEGALGATLSIDNLIVGDIGSAGIDVCATQGNHSIKCEKIGYNTFSGILTIFAEDLTTTDVLQRTIPMTRAPPNACGQYVESGMTEASILFRCVPSDGNISIPGFSTMVVPQSGLQECIPVGTFGVTYQKPGFITKTTNITVTQEMCESMNTFPIDIVLDEPLAANFTSDATTVPQGGVINFYDTSTGNPVYWMWSLQISGGTTDYLYTQDISWEYHSVGTFSVTLKVRNSVGEESTKTGYITVTEIELEKPVVDFTAEPLYGVSPLEVHFYGTATNSPEWFSWWIDPNINFSGEQNPVHTFTTGTYSIQLNVGNAVGESGEFKSHYITVVDTPVCPECPEYSHCDGASTDYVCVPDAEPEFNMSQIVAVAALGIGALLLLLTGKDDKKNGGIING